MFQKSNWTDERQFFALILAAYLVVLPALVWIPTLFAHAQGVQSAAQQNGYNNQFAHFTAIAWIVLTTGAASYWGRAHWPNEGVAARDTEPHAARLHPYVLPALTVAGLFIFYFPPALAASGPIFEEKIHLTALHRMSAGDIPYRDFEFLYGPLMLYPAHWWMELTGYSLQGFHWYILVMEIIVFLAILVPLQKYAKGRWHLLFAFVIVASLYFNPMLGPNQSGLRRLAGVLILIHLSANPFEPRYWIIRGVALGLLLSYSQEFGGATAIAITAIYGTLYAKQRDMTAVRALVITGAVSALTWLVTVAILLGPNTLTYFHELAALTRQFNAGEAAFKFYWTLNSLSVFAIVALAAVAVGMIVSRKWTDGPSQSDLMMIGGLAYAAFILKSGLSRTDQWHLVPAIAPLLFTFLLFPRGHLFQLPRQARISGIVLTVLVAATFTYGNLPVTKFIVKDSVLRGYGTLLRGDTAAVDAERQPAYPATVYRSRRESAPPLIELSQFLATDEMRGRRVFPYNGAWHYAMRIGVLKAGHLTDNFIYGDARGHAEQEMLESNADVLVLMFRSDYDWLLLGPDAAARAIPEGGLNGTGWERYSRVLLSSPHFSPANAEYDFSERRWRRLVGNYVIENYDPVFLSAQYAVLERKSVQD